MPLKDEYTSVELSEELGMPMPTIRMHVSQGNLRPTGKRKSTRGKPMNTFSKHEVERFLQWRYGKVAR